MEWRTGIARGARAIPRLLDWAALMPGQGGQQGGGSMSKQPTEQTWSIYRIKGTLAVLLG